MWAERIYSADKTHQVIFMENAGNLWLCKGHNVKCTDGGLGGEGVTMLVSLNSGEDAQIEPITRIFPKSTVFIQFVLFQTMLT